MAAAVPTYVYPVAGAVAPTLSQAAQVNEVVVDVAFAAGATIVSVVHNMNILAPVGGAAGSDGRPRISVVARLAGTALNQPVIAIVDANTISIAQTLASANTDATYRVWIQRPQSISR